MANIEATYTVASVKSFFGHIVPLYSSQDERLRVSAICIFMPYNVKTFLSDVSDYETSYVTKTNYSLKRKSSWPVSTNLGFHSMCNRDVWGIKLHG